ncbi:DUF6037 family protein [Tatumella ptyseos]|uniref:DUF6037 family protein n=1 Tax=Tatumella ptyseos TaxID=82987 RepID=UPI0026EA8679|nr:DUF6037 family protein [Tatumella ptyseos]WKX27949.1 DUF6037 family protein [Tatumella ptyseos]
MPQIVMQNIKDLYYEMRKNNIEVQIYNVKLGAIGFNVCFSIAEIPFVLTLTSRTNTPEFFLFNITKGFKIETLVDNPTFQRLRKLLYVGNNGGKLKTKEFFHNLDNGTPTKCNLAEIDKSDILNLRRDITYDRERPYFDHWRHHLTDGRKVSAENLTKTLALLGRAAYEDSRKNNTSAIWSATPLDKDK